MNYLRAVSGVICICLLAGCSAAARTGRMQAKPSADLLALPAPSSYVRRVSTAAGAAVLGAQYLSAKQVSAGGTVGLLSPDFDGASLASAAWAVYKFPAGTLSGEDRLQLMWQSIPAAGDLWVGLGDQAADRWDWFNAVNPSLLQFPATDKYAAPDGGALVAVLLLGHTQARLAALRFGDDTEPVAALSTDPSSGLAPFDVTLDASGSADPNDTIVNYAWDLDGNGSYETDGGASSTYSIYVDELPQQQTVGVQITDLASNTASAAATIDITGTQYIQPPAETYSNTGDWLVDAYKPLPEWRDGNRCYQNAWFADEADKLLQQINDDRAANSLPPLTRSTHFELVAQAHARNMALNLFLNDLDQYSLHFWNRVSMVAGAGVGASIPSWANRQDTITTIVNDSFMHSLILNAGYTHAGIGHYGNADVLDSWNIMLGNDNEAADWTDPDEVP
jgi:uncharacterized protein YkwD